MKTVKNIQKVINKIGSFTSVFSFISLLAMMLLIAVDVILRKFFGSAILGSYEIVQYMLMIFVFASFAFGQVKKQHIRVTLILNKLPWKVHSAVNGLWEFICGAAAAIMGYSCLVHGTYLLNKDWTSDVLRFPLFPFHYFAALMMFVFALVILCDSMRYFFAVFDKEYAEQAFKEYN